MQRGVGALAGLIGCLAAASGASAQTTPAPMVMTMAPMAPASGGGRVNPMPHPGAPLALALDARALRGTRTASGYRLSGQALVKDACTAARFAQVLGNIFPPLFDLMQFRRLGTMGMFCIRRLTWVTAQPLNVSSAAPPRYVTVGTQKGTTRVPIR